MEQKNEVHLTGGIVRIHEMKNITIITIAITGPGINTYYPTITFFNPDMTRNLRVGERITINGHMQVYITEKAEKRKYKQMIVADEVKKTERLLAPYIENEEISKTNGGLKPDENYAFVFGEIKNVYAASNNIYVLSIAVHDGKNHTNNCEVACFKRQAAIAQFLQEGDFVMVAGTVQTSRRPSGETVQNIVCRDILKYEDES